MDFNALMARADNTLIATFNVGAGEKKGVTLWPGESREVTIQAVFDNPYERTDIAGGGDITGITPSFTAHGRDITNLKKRDAVEIIGQTWYVKELRPDGSGVTQVALSQYQKSRQDQAGGRL
ncbi:head-tail joining protein [Klebsiella aerogenes]